MLIIHLYALYVSTSKPHSTTTINKPTAIVRGNSGILLAVRYSEYTRDYDFGMVRV